MILSLCVGGSLWNANAFLVDGPSRLAWIGHRARTLDTSLYGGSRSNRISSLVEWSREKNIATSKSISLKDENNCGLGWFAVQDIPANQVLLTVPTDVAITVEQSNKENSTPWYVAMAIQLCSLDITKYKAWYESLPRQLDTPLHWNPSAMQELQYKPMEVAVQRQTSLWKEYYQTYVATSTSTSNNISYEQFVWGCEMARSRAFSGYGGNAFSPLSYAFLLLLVTIYVGLNLGTLEQAANGAGIVLSVNILRDFVVPKLLRTNRYVVCPVIDMVNHQGTNHQCQVSFEYFQNSYSLTSDSSTNIAKGDQIYISYGARSNDQLLQYYGFVETNNPHDVYILPPLREWDITTMEQATGRTVAPGRLQKLDRAGLLGGIFVSDDEQVSNPTGGVVVTRSTGLDPAILQALRALLSTDAEWQQAGEAIGNLATTVSTDNEAAACNAARAILEMELASKVTTLEQDEKLLQQARKTMEPEDRLAILFRIEKKKLLQECIDSLQ